MAANREQIHLPSGHSFRLLRWDRNLSDVEVVQTPLNPLRIKGEGSHWHYHQEMELTLFLEGEGTRFVGDHIGPIQPGDLVLLGGNLPHYWHARGVSAGLSAQWCFPESHAFWAFPETMAFSELFDSTKRGICYTGRTAAVVRACLQEMSGSAGGDRLGLFIRALSTLAAATPRERSFLSARSFSMRGESVYQEVMGKAVRFLLTNFRNDVRLEDVLQLTGVCKPTFSRQFKRYSGKTFIEFLQHVRLESACHDLVDTGRPVIDIAFSCGFTQISFFNRLFRRIHHCSPSQDRRRKKPSSRS